MFTGRHVTLDNSGLRSQAQDFDTGAWGLHSTLWLGLGVKTIWLKEQHVALTPSAAQILNVHKQTRYD